MRGLELHRPQAVVLDEEHSDPKYGVFTAQPFERGWGVTIGNALRRILLSSIEGSAIVAVRFAGVHHEYDSIPGVMEDVTDLILNLKRVPLKLTGPESVTATLQVSEPGVLKAGAIKGGPELSIVDPGVYLATLAEEGAIDAELVIHRGRGYVPADDQDTHNLGVGFIYLDAAYSPVRKANYRIEPARVGQATDYEKLVLEIWTNGAVTPAGAVVEAARLLAEHLPIFQNLEEVAAPKPVSKTEGVLEKSIEELELGGRITNMLRNAGVGSVRELVATGEDELIAIPGFGKKALTEVREKLEALGLGLGVRFDLPRT
ncbi:MAG TPA: DNA-directed RNA polymerase subunit alpha [Thermoanaerobaculaceae bacterium]|jgi:DNA-directed RNA polymerase subunit alpha|nr:DNA-directed RNA polymerase subunit alpha [Thermoanaerobaculaceae bacterium]